MLVHNSRDDATELGGPVPAIARPQVHAPCAPNPYFGVQLGPRAGRDRREDDRLTYRLLTRAASADRELQGSASTRADSALQPLGPNPRRRGSRAAWFL